MTESWCFLGALDQGLAMLLEGHRVLGAPMFIAAPSGSVEAAHLQFKSLAEKFGVPLLAKEQAFVELENRPTLRGLVCRFDIIPGALLNQRPDRFLNLHNSLLPRWRGVHPLQWALLNGDVSTGVTYHVCTEKIDSGAIAYQDEFPILETDSIVDLFAKALKATRAGTITAVENWIERKFEPQKESPLPYAYRLTANTQRLTQKMSASEMNRRVRISQPPWPRAFFESSDHAITVVGSVVEGAPFDQSNVLCYEGYLFSLFTEEDKTLFEEFLGL